MSTFEGFVRSEEFDRMLADHLARMVEQHGPQNAEFAIVKDDGGYSYDGSYDLDDAFAIGWKVLSGCPTGHWVYLAEIQGVQRHFVYARSQDQAREKFAHIFARAEEMAEKYTAQVTRNRRRRQALANTGPGRAAKVSRARLYWGTGGDQWQRSNRRRCEFSGNCSSSAGR